MRAVTQDFYHYIPVVRYFTNSVYGDEMAIAGTTYDLTDLVFDGDSSAWTLTVQNSPSDFEVSSDQNHTDGGTYSLSFEASETEDYAQFTRSSPLDLTDYLALSFTIYITAWGAADDIIMSAWNGTTQVGEDCSLKPYISTGQVNEWQHTAVALASCGLTGQTIDAIRFTIIGNGTAPDGFIDDIEFRGSSVPVVPTVFTIEPQEEEDLVVESLHYTFCDIADVTSSTGDYTNLDPSAFVTIPALGNGLSFRRYTGGQLLFTNVWKTLGDILCSPNCRITNVVSNGTNSLVTVQFDYPNGGTLLRYRNADKIVVAVADDLSALTRFRISVAAKLRVPHSRASV